MNYGAFIYEKQLFNKFEIKEIAQLAEKSKASRTRIHASGNYSHLA